MTEPQTAEAEPRSSTSMLFLWFVWLALVWVLLGYAFVLIAHQL